MKEFLVSLWRRHHAGQHDAPTGRALDSGLDARPGRVADVMAALSV